MRFHLTQSRHSSVFLSLTHTQAPLHAKGAFEITCVFISRNLVTPVCFSDTPAPLHAKDAFEITCVFIPRNLVTQVCLSFTRTHRRRFTQRAPSRYHAFSSHAISSLKCVSLSHTHTHRRRFTHRAPSRYHAFSSHAISSLQCVR